MGFFKKVAQAFSAPVTVPLKVTSNVVREVGEAVGAEFVSKPLSTLAAAPYNAIQKGEGISNVLPSVVSSARELAPLASAASGAGLLQGAIPGSSILTGMLGTAPSQLPANPQAPDQPAPAIQNVPVLQPTQNLLLPILIGGGLILAIALRRR